MPADWDSIELVFPAAFVGWLEIDDGNWFAVVAADVLGLGFAAVSANVIVAAIGVAPAVATDVVNADAVVAAVIDVAAAIDVVNGVAHVGAHVGARVVVIDVAHVVAIVAIVAGNGAAAVAANDAGIAAAVATVLAYGDVLMPVAEMFHLYYYYLAFDATQWNFGFDNVRLVVHLNRRAMHSVAVACARRRWRRPMTMPPIDYNSLDVSEYSCDTAAAFVLAVAAAWTELFVSRTDDAADWFGNSFVIEIAFASVAASMDVFAYFHSNCSCNTVDAAQNYLYSCSCSHQHHQRRSFAFYWALIRLR